LFGKVLGFYRELDRPVPAQAERKLSLELENESRIVTLPGTEKTIRGFSGASLLGLYAECWMRSTVSKPRSVSWRTAATTNPSPRL
jgi:hypothetical protein